MRRNAVPANRDVQTSSYPSVAKRTGSSSMRYVVVFVKIDGITLPYILKYVMRYLSILQLLLHSVDLRG